MEEDDPSTGDDEAAVESTYDRSFTSRQIDSQELEAQALPGASYASSGSEYEPEDEEEQHPRFHGIDSTYRLYIRNEANLLESLIKQDNTDLATHLYNAHAWKCRLYDQTGSKGSLVARSKSSWLRPNEDGKEPWYPSTDWTAWPLPPEQILSKQTSWSGPSHNPWKITKAVSDLCEEIRALMLRQAKTQSDLRHELMRSSTTDEETEQPVHPKLEPETILEEPRSPDSTKDGHTVSDGEEQPSLLDDDDEADTLLEPMLQHIASKLEDLLHGLHRNRSGHRLAEAYSRPSSSRSASQSLQDGSPVPTQSSARGQRVVQYGPRDWSEVLGVASIVGWDPAIINKTKQRCTEIFGENMSFRTFPEPIPDKFRELPEYQPDQLPRSTYASEEEEEDEEDDDVDMMDHRPAPTAHRFCPYPTCARSEVSYDKAWRWREHLKRTHELTDRQVHDIEHGDLADHIRATDNRTIVGCGYPCPYEGCPRQRRGYEQRWRLHEHLKKAHDHTLDDARKLAQDIQDENDTV